jgi:hypothetical protein
LQGFLGRESGLGVEFRAKTRSRSRDRKAGRAVAAVADHGRQFFGEEL